MEKIKYLNKTKNGKGGLTIQKKKVLTFLTIALLTIAAFYAGYTIASPSNTFTISNGVYPGAASYTVWRDGNYYYAKNAYGAIDYSGTDAASVIQSAINACPNGSSIFIKSGEYEIKSEILITKPLTITGEHAATERYQSLYQVVWGVKMSVMTLGITAFHIQCDEAVIIENIIIFYKVINYAQPSSGIGILIEGTNSTNWNKQSIFRNLRIVSFWKGIYSKAGSAWVVDNCYIALNYYGVYLENIAYGDAGDNTIVNSVISGNMSWGYLVYQTSSGGLRIENSKLLYGSYGIYLSINSATSNLIVVGNSIENQITQAIHLDSSVLFFNVLITDNQFGGLGGGGKYIQISSSYIEGVNIANNVFRGTSGTSGTYGVYIGSGTSILISGNRFDYQYYAVYNYGGTQITVHGNVFKACTNSISGTVDSADNYSYS